MKNKKVTYLLVFMVMLVWGAVVYKYFSGSSESEDNQLVYHAPSYAGSYTFDAQVDTFKILADYRDPFFGDRVHKIDKKNIRYSARVKMNTAPQKITEEEEKKEAIVWPRLKYKGLINSSGNQVGLLSLNNRERIVMIGDSLDEVYVKRLTMDSAKVVYKGENKVLYK